MLRALNHIFPSFRSPTALPYRYQVKSGKIRILRHSHFHAYIHAPFPSFFFFLKSVCPISTCRSTRLSRILKRKMRIIEGRYYAPLKGSSQTENVEKPLTAHLNSYQVTFFRLHTYTYKHKCNHTHTEIERETEKHAAVLKCNPNFSSISHSHTRSTPLHFTSLYFTTRPLFSASLTFNHVTPREGGKKCKR